MFAAVQVQDVSKKFGNPYLPAWKRMPRLQSRSGAVGEGLSGITPVVVAVDQVSFAIQPGEIFGLVGPSGAGKSTLIRLIATLLQPDSGQIRVFDHDVVRQPGQVQRLINPVKVEASFFKKLSPVENLLQAQSNRASSSEARERVVQLLARLELDSEAVQQPMEEMSHSLQQKVTIARALLSQPRLLLLDDPLRGLDPQSKDAIGRALQALRDEHGTTILMTTRDYAEAAGICDRVAVLEDGKITRVESPCIPPANLENPFEICFGKPYLKVNIQ